MTDMQVCEWCGQKDFKCAIRTVGKFEVCFECYLKLKEEE